MLNVDEQIARVEKLYRQVAGSEPKRGEAPSARIPPDADPEKYVEERLRRLETALRESTAAQATGAVLPSFAPRVSVFESEREWLCVVELPGVKKTDLSLSAAQGVLRIAATRAQIPGAVGTERPTYLEVTPCRFERLVALSPMAKEEALEARLDSGVLTVRCPKEPVAIRKETKIEVA